MRKRITISLPADLLDRARRKAAAQRRTLASLVEQGLREVCEHNERAKAKRVMPRISAASGGPMPGIDLTRSAAIQEMEDLDTIERMKSGR